MVRFVKVYAEGELRRMQIGDSISYDELKQKVSQLFPTLKDGSVEFSLQYTDIDGDSVTLSSDDEVHAALAHLPPDQVWRVQVVRARGPRQQLGHRGSLTGRGQVFAPFSGFGGFSRPLFGRGLAEELQSDPFWSPSSLFSWGSHERRQREWDDLIRQQEEQVDKEMERLKRMQEDHMKQFEEKRKRAEEDIRAKLQSQKSVTEQSQTAAASSGESGGAVAQQGQPNWHCQSYGSWEPVVYDSPYGRRTVIGPVGYHMYWGYSDPEEPMESEEKKEEGEKKEETAEASSKL